MRVTKKKRRDAGDWGPGRPRMGGLAFRFGGPVWLARQVSQGFATGFLRRQCEKRGKQRKPMTFTENTSTETTTFAARGHP